MLVGHEGELSDAHVDKVNALPGIASTAHTADGLLVQLDGTTPARLLAELVRLEIPVTSFGPNRRLEDAFLTLIAGGSA